MHVDAGSCGDADPRAIERAVLLTLQVAAEPETAEISVALLDDAGMAVLNTLPGLRFPLGTLIVNVLGCLLIGIVGGYTEHTANSPHVRLFLMAGFLGGFTTFSAFGYETLALMRGDALGLALIYAGLSVILCLGAVWFGLRMAAI